MTDKILIVDDDVESLKLIALMLQRRGFNVIAANSGTQALSKLSTDLPDLIILDVMMPDMSGYEVCKRIRDNPATRDIPVLMFTAKTLIDDKVAGFEAGADDYLTKPTHPEELTSRIRSMLSRSTKPEPPKPALTGRAIGVFGVKGGIGTTTLAVNLAASYARDSTRRALIADFQLGTGGVGLQLGVAHAGMANVLSCPPQDIQPSMIDPEIVQHAAGMYVLASSPAPKEVQVNFPSEATVRTLEALRRMYDVVICDIGTRYTQRHAHLLRLCDHNILLVEPTEPSMVLAEKLLSEIKADTRKPVDVVVVNRSTRSHLAWHDVEERLSQEILSIVAFAQDVVSQAMDEQTPVVAYKPSAVVSTQMIKIADDVHARVGG